MPTDTTEQPTRPWGHLIDAVLATPAELLPTTVIDGERALAHALADCRLIEYPYNYQGTARRVLQRMALYLAADPPPF